MGSTIRLAVIHQSRLLRECMVSVLTGGRGLEVTSGDPNSDDLLESLAQGQPHVVLIDLSLPGRGAVHLTQEFARRLQGAKIVLLARSGSHENLLECIAAGAHGCVLEETSLDELQAAVERVLRGEMFCSPEIVQSMFTQLAQVARDSAWRERVSCVSLTARELEILHLIADRLSNKEIAKRLCLSLHTVKNHVHNIVEKLHVEDRHGAVEYARQHRWLRHGASRFDPAHG